MPDEPREQPDEPREREGRPDDTAPFAGSGADPETGDPQPTGTAPRRFGRGSIVAVAVIGLLAALYGLDVATSQGNVPRGVTVADVKIGGMEPAAAQQTLRARIGPRLNRPITLRAGDRTAMLNPGQAGLSLNWPATIERAGAQPLNPWTRLTSLFSTREVGVVTDEDRAALTRAVRGLRARLDRPPREGDVRFDGARPVAVEPRAGQQLQVDRAVDAILAGWASGQPIELPVREVSVQVGSEQVRQALDEVARPAASAPVTVTGDNDTRAVLEPTVIADSLRFEPTDEGELNANLKMPVVVDALAPQLAGTETEVRDAKIKFQGSSPTVVPAKKGHTVDWDESLAGLMDVLTSSDGDRTMPAVYTDTEPDFTTAEARSVDASTVVGEFTTRGFAQDSGVNIRQVAEEVDGAVVEPGENFSLNGYTGHRGAAQGYVEAGIIKNGRPAEGIGGGISQFATTLYNAAYFAGMTDVEHHEHSYYISRYPEGREATVFEGALDLAFRNDTATPVLIQTNWTPNSISVKFLGTEHYEVESQTSERSDITEPGTKRISAEPCIETSGKKGFTVSNTRISRDAQTGDVVNRSGHTTVYEPRPEVICTGGDGTAS